MTYERSFQRDKLDEYFKFMNTRHAIYLDRKDGVPWPWTEDEVLQTYAFTNVYRELDRVTVWLRENWREPYDDHPMLAFNLAMFRQFNWPPTMEQTGFITADLEDEREWEKENGLPEDPNIMYEWDAQALTEVVEAYQKAGNKVFTGAYMIRGQCINPTGIEWTSKAQYMFHQVLEPVWEAQEPLWDKLTLEQACDWWQQFEGFGPFLSYEIVTDMRHTRLMKNASDIMTWANPGPGAMRGIHRLMGWDVKATLKKRDWYVEKMRHLLAYSQHEGVLRSWMDPLEMRDIEHVLCEFDKYERARLGEGRPRAKFVPPHKRK